MSVLATGGTIASRSDPGGAATAQDAGADLVSGLPLPADVRVRVRVRDVLRVGGFRMTLDRVHTLAAAVAAELRDRSAGVPPAQLDGPRVPVGVVEEDEGGEILVLRIRPWRHRSV